MKLLQRLKTFLWHFGFILSAILFLKKLNSRSVEGALKKSAELESNSSLLKKVSAIIQQAYKDAGISYPISIDYSLVKNEKLNLLTQQEFNDHQQFNDNEVYLITDSQNLTVTPPTWDLYRKFSFQDHPTKYKITFKKNQQPCAGEELGSAQINAVKDVLLIDANVEYSNYNMANIYLAFKAKAAVEISGAAVLLPDHIIYALAAHEAMHEKYKHSVIDSMIHAGGLYLGFRIIHYTMSSFPGFVSFPSSALAAIYFYSKLLNSAYTKNSLSQQIEKSADIMAAKQLGVAKDLSEYFSVMANMHPDEPADGEHPPMPKRIEYLTPYLQQNSLFNQFQVTLNNQQAEELKANIEEADTSPRLATSPMF